MSGAEIILLSLARHYARSNTTRDLELDAALWRAAQRLEREGAIEITQTSDGFNFSAAIAARAA